MLNKKLLLSGLLIIPVLLFVGFTFPWDKPEKTPVNNTMPVKTDIQKEDGVVVYYFYAKPRCVSCKKIETYIQEAVSELNNSELTYKAINLDKPENKHYYKDYGLYTKAVVLSEIKNGEEVKSKNLTDIWTKLGNEKAFKDYVTKEIKSYIGG